MNPLTCLSMVVQQTECTILLARISHVLCASACQSLLGQKAATKDSASL